MIPDSLFVLLFAAVMVAGFWMIGKSTDHDRRLEPVEPVDWDAAEEERDTRYEDDADSARKGEQ